MVLTVCDDPFSPCAGIWKRLINQYVENFGKRLCSKLRGPRCLQFSFTLAWWTFLACTFDFPISGHVMFSWEFSLCFLINYAYILHMRKTIPYNSLTWREVGKQNVQAKKVCSLQRVLILWQSCLS